MKQQKFLIIGGLVLSIVALVLLVTYSGSFLPGKAVAADRQAGIADEESAIAAAVIADLAAQGWKEEFAVYVEAIEGDVARVRIESLDDNAPGGFGGYARKENSSWFLLIYGSAMRPDDLEAAGVPQSLLPEGWITE